MTGRESLPALGIYTRLASVQEAERLGFLPTTHQEKNSALEYADYLEYPERYPGGVHDRLMEIYDHQRGVFCEQGRSNAQARILAGTSVKSVLHTYGDYLANARMSYRQLSALARLVAETPSPSISLEQAIEESRMELVAVGALVRYSDLNMLVKKLEWQYPFDPLLTVDNRTNPLEGAKKRIEDVYTGENDRVVAERIKEFLRTTTIKQLRDVPEKALNDQSLRGKFWRHILEGAKGPYVPIARTILETADIKPKAA